MRTQFQTYSPIWYITSQGVQTELAYEDAGNNWKWTISQQRPERYNGRIHKEDQATLVITDTKTEDSGYYGCKLRLNNGTELVSEARLVVYGKVIKLSLISIM